MGQFASTREQRWTDPDTEGGFQVSRQGKQGEQGEQGERGEQGEQGEQGKQGEQGEQRADLVHKSGSYIVYVCDE